MAEPLVWLGIRFQHQLLFVQPFSRVRPTMKANFGQGALGGAGGCASCGGTNGGGGGGFGVGGIGGGGLVDSGGGDSGGGDSGGGGGGGGGDAGEGGGGGSDGGDGGGGEEQPYTVSTGVTHFQPPFCSAYVQGAHPALQSKE